MKDMNIPVGVSDFEKIRNGGFYYIDKSGLITRILKEKAEVTLIARPRRFGKTLGMSMLESFFDIRKDSRKLFDGLEIAENQALCDEWMNQYPTVSISFRQIDGLNFMDAYRQLVYEIALLYQKHTYLLDSQAISNQEKSLFQQISDRKAEKTDVMRSIQFLTLLLNKHYNKKVILLIDEYDVPLAKASSNGYYSQMLEMMKTMLSTALKDNPSLHFAVITGCLKIAKESIFTGTNNFVSDTITSTRLSEYFGFTQTEVDRILDDARMRDKAEQVKAWYDGYHFGDFDVYCPWDVMSYLRDVQRDPAAMPVGYWKNTSDNAIIRSFIDYAGNSITRKMETLLSGGYIVQRIEENLTYDYLHASEENLWSILYLTGYLTREKGIELPEGMAALMIPNAEIRDIFENTVIKWFDDSAQIWDRKKLFDAVWQGDSEKITQEMNALLRMTISYHDYREDFYHAFLAGIFAGAGYTVESNREHGEGRSDVVVFDARSGRVAIFEAKYAQRLEKLTESCHDALRQMDERKYAQDFEDSYDQIFCYGIAFFKKRCLVQGK